MTRADAIEILAQTDVWDEEAQEAFDMAIAALRDQQGYSPVDQTPPNRFLAQTKWGKVVLVERRSWGDPDWLVGGLYIPKDITWWWPLPEPVGGAE